MPRRRVSAASIGGAVAIVLVWLLGLAGADVPAEVGAAIGSICVFVGGYVVRDAAPEEA